ncbi:hypothetical protein TRVA0_016S01882 [Trichomonascus vanleenenianus]|uniref:uncharacterized protein n=1 Tax=Trichomonascus vanleenenianus TaxID=2268995 RepID=UPI003ECB9235
MEKARWNYFLYMKPNLMISNTYLRFQVCLLFLLIFGLPTSPQQIKSSCARTLYNTLRRVSDSSINACSTFTMMMLELYW